MLGKAFDPAKFRSQSIYFVATPLRRYLRRIESQIADSPEKLQAVLDELDARLRQIDVIVS